VASTAYAPPAADVMDRTPSTSRRTSLGVVWSLRPSNGTPVKLWGPLKYPPPPLPLLPLLPTLHLAPL
jgi:hypothetical protein